MRFLLIFFTILFMAFSSSVDASTPVVKSDSRTFNPLTATYNLKGNVYVEIGSQIITADEATVSLLSLEVHGKGNIKLNNNDISFSSNSVDVYGTQSTAYCIGNCVFAQANTKITADQGSFNWKTKIATFDGNVIVNDTPKSGTIKYNVITKEFLQ